MYVINVILEYLYVCVLVCMYVFISVLYKNMIDINVSTVQYWACFT